MLLGMLSKDRIFIFFPNHLWGVSNNSDKINGEHVVEESTAHLYRLVG
ncbi:hypothetical protein JCM19232_4037 [Vibrio ishigakensis]|uniref:Uncharacterized protein n=1 Tax=Vibrio ishigakensis TaxID=1481914 RepID=A0A0B8P2U1_9VIBR|nr:hypothetical protein JCM19232_4037 [Vibrio ishigakensis]